MGLRSLAWSNVLGVACIQSIVYWGMCCAVGLSTLEVFDFRLQQPALGYFMRYFVQGSKAGRRIMSFRLQHGIPFAAWFGSFWAGCVLAKRRFLPAGFTRMAVLCMGFACAALVSRPPQKLCISSGQRYRIWFAASCMRVRRLYARVWNLS